MKAICNRQALLTALDACRPCIRANTPKPILRNVKLHVGTETTMEATSLDQAIMYHVSGVDARDYGTVLVDAAKLGEILKSTDDDEITITLDGDNLTFRSDGGRFKLPTKNADEFPSCQWLDGDYQEIRGGDLATAIKRTSFAAGESSRYALDSIAFDVTHGMAVATNGKCLATYPLALKGEERDDDKSHLLLVSPSAAANALKCISDPDEPLRVRIADNAIQFSAAKATHWSRLVEGRFPTWRDIFPGNPTQTVEFTARELAAALRRAKVATSEESMGVALEFGNDLLELKASAACVGEAETSLACHCQPLNVTFDPDLILGFLRVLDADARVAMKFIDGRKAAVLESGEAKYVVMPLTKER